VSQRALSPLRGLRGRGRGSGRVLRRHFDGLCASHVRSLVHRVGFYHPLFNNFTPLGRGVWLCEVSLSMTDFTRCPFPSKMKLAV
jgi:hypothetical protein